MRWVDQILFTYLVGEMSSVIKASWSTVSYANENSCHLGVVWKKQLVDKQVYHFSTMQLHNMGLELVFLTRMWAGLNTDGRYHIKIKQMVTRGKKASQLASLETTKWTRLNTWPCTPMGVLKAFIPPSIIVSPNKEIRSGCQTLIVRVHFTLYWGNIFHNIHLSL